MKSGFERFIEAIVADDRNLATKVLADDPAMAIALITRARLYPDLHWIYAGDTPLHVAAAGYRVEIGRALLEAGADPNAAKNHRRSRPLHYAADGRCGNANWSPERQVAMIQILLGAGAEIDAPDANGATALHRAVRTRSAAAVQALLAAGANPVLRNKPGSTAFHLAVQNTGRGGSGVAAAKVAQREIIHAFLSAGLKPSLKDGRGKSVLDWAKSDSIRELLAN
jgi:ankyrin repeat protein